LNTVSAQSPLSLRVNITFPTLIVGATFLDVFVQILVVRVVIGGLAGLVASNGLVKLLSLLSPSGNSPVITWDAMLLAFSFSMLVGVLAGIFPGLKAARLHPIQALRYE
jgi:putative ABC transport system permease protein